MRSPQHEAEDTTTSDVALLNRVRPDRGQIRSFLGIWSNLAKFGSNWSIVPEPGPNLADVGPILAELGPNLGGFGPILVEFGPNVAEFGFGRFQAKVGRFWANVGPT